MESRGTVVLYLVNSLLVCKYVIPHYQVVIAVRSHLFPFRTEKLSSLAPMVLQCGRVGSRLLLSRASDFERFLRLFSFSRRFFSHAACFFCPTDSTDGTDLLCPADKINEELYPLSSDRIGQFVFYFLEYLLMG